MKSSRELEIEQGLRHPGGSLTFALDSLEYGQGFSDFNDDMPPPRVTSPSYDLGRALGQRRQEEAAEHAAMLARLDAEDQRRRQSVREMLAHRPDVLAEYDAKMAELDAAHPRARPTD